MEANNMVLDETLEVVAGGKLASTARFQVGDKVTLIVYPEFGVGTVASIYMQGGIWKCVVRFDSGIIEASDIEFIPA